MYTRINTGSRLARVAVLVDHLASALIAERLPRTQADAARAQIDEMVALLAGRKDADARALASALRRLSNQLTQVDGRRRARKSDEVRNRRLLRALRRIALILATSAAVSAPFAAAAAVPIAEAPPAVVMAIPVLAVGDPVLNPATGLNEEVVEVISPAVVRTNLGNFILLATTVGDVFSDPETGESYEVTAVVLNGSGNPVTVTVEDSGGAATVLGVVTDQSGQIAGVTPDPDGPDGSGASDFVFPTAGGDVNNFDRARRGDDGGDGSDGGGVRICVPVLGCATIGFSPSNGGNGATGPTVNEVVDSAWGDIQTVSAGLPGIVVSSVGGNGGQGGDGYGIDIPGARGGQAGEGGPVTLDASVTVTTTGSGSHGIFAQSRSGRGGNGGTGYIASGGGGGGTSGQGGTVHVTHSGQISTSGDGAMGILAQSLGGAAGGGGDSYGIIGDGGGGSSGGNGGSVTVDHSGVIETAGGTAHGVLAQSIGGSGGNAGNSGGIVTFGDSGDAGGNGGSASIIARAGSSTLTTGEGSHGLFAQSVGGGGGNGGNAGGLVTLGSGGGSGGTGGSATIQLETGGVVGTSGDYSFGLFAQSVGGGGGDSGSSGGLVTLGASGDAGGAGGAVQITTGGDVTTDGLDSRGVFAQSVGGGGGAARGVGGVVSLGGGGAAGGAGGAVTVTATDSSSVITGGDGSDGLFAQSVGGGGGSGSSSGGVVSLGGTGGGGGAGGAVSVTHGGEIETGGLNSRGIFAQSVGGGGGSGGHSGGLVSIGGSGGAASHGGDVGVINTGSITTAGNLSSAIQAQSIGGGGGDGGTTGGVFLTIGGSGGSGGGGSGSVTVEHSGGLFTSGDDSHGIFAQAVGGGGGNGGASVSVSAFAGAAVGGAGGNGGAGGVVNVNLTQSLVNIGGTPTLIDPLIVTRGDRARGVFAQSVGGGGGNGGFAAQVSAGYGIGASIAIGGSAGLGGVGGEVNLNGDAVILTEGDFAQGVFAQSVGGGGGNGGFATAFSFAAGETAAAAFSVGVGGSGGTGGQGGLVEVGSGGAIETRGDFSTGFITQSVGGGGGNGGFSVSFAGSGAGVASAAAAVGVGGSGGSGGVGGTVDALFDGTILTGGDDSRAALIQSVGGGGGNGGFNIAGAVSISGVAGVAAAVGVGGAAGDGGAGGTVTGRVGGAVQTGGDRSTGVTVQSVGGGGGSGGFNISGSIGGGGNVGGAVSVGIGGAGGGGGAGGDVTGSSGSTILTTGDQSGGLLVQSVGGGGGDGGFNVAGSIGGSGTVGAALSVGVGGAGGGGGGGGTVIGHAEGVVQTAGDQATAVTVQSIGGGGGSGAFNVSGSIGGGGTVGAGLSVGVGGAGGGGGDGGAVTASAVGVSTSGDQSGGFLAQSVGGGGGNGGFDITGSIGGGGTVGAGVSVGIGGSGGGGGLGGSVGATVTGDAITVGDEADAIVAQSIGGGGGNGGFTVAGSIGASGGAAGAVSVGIGGSGGLGGESGQVTLDVIGAAGTAGLNSDAIVAQSIGGGGGNGGFAVAGNIAGAAGGAGTVGIGVGGFGGGGGDAGGATLRVNTGVADAGDALLAAQTTGDGARAIMAQSVGGGGGNGSFSVTGGISGAKGAAGNVGVGIGGGGGDGGDGGVVIADVNGDVLTTGHDATGIFAQSLGGGGGNGGFTVAGGISGSKGGAGNLMVGVGGFGGGGGDGGTVSGLVTSDVTTLGDRSTAVTYQSVGGGGGNGGFTVSGGIAGSAGGSGSVSLGVGGGGGDGGAGGEVDVDITGLIQTAGDSSDGVLAQSVGGGGGNGAFAITGNVAFSAAGAGTLGVGIGGMGGGGGDSAAVTLKLNDGVLDPADTLIAALTTGDGSRAVVAQSIGGGGGNGGFSITAGLSLAKGAAGNLGVGIGGGGGDGGASGDVSGEITGDVRTGGDDASAVLVQSVGGGGGNGGFNITGGLTGAKAAAGNLMVGVGGFGGLGGDAGDVSGGVEGDILTLGDRSFGMTYQSLGGGGGNGAFNITGGVSLSIASGAAGNLGVGVGGFGGDGGDSGDVDAYLTGDIDTFGRESYGALLQSVGGGGGNGGFNITGGLSASTGGSGTLGFGLGGFGGGGGDAGAVTGVLMGDVTTSGDDSYGAMLQSLGGAGGNGGLNVTGAAAFAVNNSAAAAIGIGIGGFAGGGGDASAVDATVTGQYSTTGDNSDAVIAQSLGGGGGNGGLNVTGALSLSTGTAGTGSIGIGGFGGVGGDAGDVSLVRTGDTATDGLNSDGVMAQSVGGGGGNGGINVSGGLTASSGGTAGSLGFGLGGFGGGGGDAGDVTAVVTGNVHARGAGPVVLIPAVSQTTILPDSIVGIVDQIVPGAFETIERPAYESMADGSHGVVAQSVGGGGGSGGLNVTGQVSLVVPGGSHASRSVSIGVGGFGGSGGDAGHVDLTVQAPGADRVQVSAIGDDRSAVIAQSVGGGGGVGGINISGGLAMDGVLTAGVGGFGGAGGVGRDVHADVDADLFATGARSRGMMVQSVGGGGGSGAINISGGVSGDPAGQEPSLTFGLGGFGGAGNISGDVTARQNGQILVQGFESIGLLAQSVAGGGGSGGLNVSADVHLGRSDSRAHGVAIGVGVGGSGGDGADAGDVSVDSVGDIFINAQARSGALPGEDAWESIEYAGNSVGLLAQSVGGGGGVGGINITGVVAPFGQPASIGVGGSGGSGGHGGTVDVVRGYATVAGIETPTSGLIRTFGANSDALVAQSIGGGGGRAGMNFTFALTASTPNNNALAALITVGGSGAGAGSGDDVSVRHYGDLVTAGSNSAGLVAQSVGGGGGDANFNIGFGVLRNATALNLAIGGDVGAGGSGGDVSVAHVGTIVTSGRASNGVRAQSIGGGGGNTALDMAVGILATNSLSVTLGRQGGTGGTGGNVDVDVDGIIDTSGDDSTAVFAQSVGGGGGASSAIVVGASGTRSPNTADAASYGGSIAVGLDGGVGATSGDVSVISDGDITTRGDDARGIHAQSIGGGGGTGGSAGNVIFRAAGAATVSVGGTGGVGATSGEVEVDNAAQIVTLGARSDGILAQSIGGGGGLAGSARTIAIQVGGVPSGTTTRTASVNVGGTGGTGAVGDLVDVANTGVIATQGELSHGIRAQSIGGGGGVGGAAINFRAQGTRSNDSFDVNIGGSGGTGGAGGAVNVLNEGLIYTQGRAATGISANSIGGGGGDAGVVLDVVAGGTGADQQSHRVVMNIGGSGGSGGVGGEVTVTNHTTGPAETGQIVTRGADAYGIFAQSLGGGGGNGSSIISITGLRSGSDSFVAGLTLGGSGGSGDAGGLVTVNNDGLIDTHGAGAHGILAQSIGGGGGNGGLAITAAGLIGAASSTPLITIGGTGGDGGDSDRVTVNNSGRIITRGAGAHGIVAQSIGGGGGNAQMGFSLGGEAATLALSTTLSALVGVLGGGSGGSGGEVVVNHSGDITVLGDGSMAIKAESINGGGGTLTLDFSGITGLPGIPFVDIHGDTVTADPLVEARAGGEGASNMNAGSVTVNTTGTLGVLGANGVGNFNQAVGGGGGSLIIRTVLAAPGPDPVAPIGIDAVLGGVDGVDNNGGDIDSQHSGDIVTTGQNTPGALFQSIGGGGGRGVIDVTVPQGALSGPVEARMGGENGLNEAGGAVALSHMGSITTTGGFAPGAILQSIGGGGGSFGINLRDENPAPAPAPAPASDPAAAFAPALPAAPVAAPVLVSLGADGGAGLDGGLVNAVFTGGIDTTGDSAIGLIVQSIGAGGGEARLSGAVGPDITLGGFNGASGAGGAVSLSNTGEVFTAGARAHGVFLQSIGGGGGAVFGDFTTATLTLNADNAGDGGAIVFDQTGDINVLGDGAFGVVAQSLGGGGGWVDGVFAGTAGGAGQGGSIDLDLGGQVFAAGDGGVAILAQSLGAGGGGDITLVSDGLVRGGAGSGAGVVFDGGDQNLITTTGSISAVSGLAIQAGEGDEQVENQGLVIGNIDLGGGDNVFHNGVDGTFIAFDTIDLRDQPAAQGVFVNDGEFQMGLGAPAFPLDLAAGDVFGDLDGAGDPAANLIYGARVINTVGLDGDFVQTADGHLEFDVAFGPYASDRVDVTGDATVDGTGDITLTWLENNDEVTLFATGGAGADNGLEISDTLALDYGVRADSAGVHLGFVSDFGQDFLNENGRSLGGSIDSALIAGGSGGIGRLAALLGNLRVGDEDIYSAIFTELDPSPHLEPLQLQFAAANSFSNDLFGCTNVVVQSGDQCVWSSLELTRRESVESFENFGATSDGVRLRAGFEQPARGLWSVAVAVGYDEVDDIRIDDFRAFSDAKSLNLGLGLRRTGPGGLETGVSASGGWQWVDTSRNMNIFGPATGISSPDSRYAQLSAHIARQLRQGAFFARPALHTSVTALHGDGFTETGLEGNGVERVSDTQYLVTANPELKFGFVFADTPGAQGVLSFTVGGVFQSEDRIESPFRMLGANPLSETAVISTPLDRETLRLRADFSIVADNGVSMRLRYQNESGDRTDSHSAGFDLRFRF
ncbi:MAG: autotransporter outer membrane beta-barrel domain-containing protein [Pseudomonadota bacterium]|nr:autotransporter outer membrane beta-barrel domain-containing protein [Pseudomonadota bacterium]